MKKRGQVTTFIIIGIVAILAIALILFLRNQMGLFIAPQNYLQNVGDNIKENLGECADKYSVDGLNLMLDQGGKINPSSYKFYNGKKVAYLCQDIPNTVACLNSLEPLSSWEEDLSNYLKLNMDQCVNIDEFKSTFGTYEVDYTGYDVVTEILNDAVVIEIKPKLTLTKDDASMNVGSVINNYEVPLGTLYGAAYDAVNSEALSGEFLNLQYMIAHQGEVEILIEDKPYPDDIYVVNKKDNIHKLYFAIQGEE